MPPLPGVLAMFSPTQNVSKSFSSPLATSSNSSIIPAGSHYFAEMSAARTDMVKSKIMNDNKFNKTSSTSSLLAMTSPSPSISTATMVPSSKNSAVISKEIIKVPTNVESVDTAVHSDSSSCSTGNSSTSSSSNSSSSSSSSSSNSSSNIESKYLISNNNTSKMSLNDSVSCKNITDVSGNDSTMPITNDSGASAENENCDKKNDENILTELSTETDSDANSSSIFGHPREILLKTVNAHITCSLCNGYLIDATTIVECLHSFCHSCIMNYLRTDQYCPRCEMMINTTKHNNIKLDTTLQAIVYKLVPGLYEKELLRKRAFYSTRPEEAKLATPEQRGDDTEHLIFGPADNMSLSLEYADLEELPPADDDIHELCKPKYLQCPANFTVSHLKKFVYGKFGIDQSRFIIDIMYKVKTIVLADHYKMMDVAYIYTWKRDAPMKFFFRVKESENRARRKRCQKPIAKTICEQNDVETKPSENGSKAEVHNDDDKAKSEIKIEIKEEALNQDVGNPTGIKVKVEDELHAVPDDCMVVVPAENTTITVSEFIPMNQSTVEIKKEHETAEKPFATATESEGIVETITADTVTPVKSGAPEGTSCDQRKEKLKITLVNKGKSSLKDEETPKSKSSSKCKSSKHSPSDHDDRKVENIKLKIDLSKQGSVTIINMSSPDSSKKEVVKPLKPEKEWKIKVKKDKDKSPNGTQDKGKLSPHERTVPPITIELDKAHSPSSNKHEPIKQDSDEDVKKSEFLNSIDLTPIKSLNASPEKNDRQKVNSSKPTFNTIPTFTIKKPSMPPPPPPAPIKTSSASKRKSKEPIKAIVKKPKLDIPLLKASTQPQIKVRSNLLETKYDKPAISFRLSPFPIGSSGDPPKDGDKLPLPQLSPPPTPPKDSEADRKLEDEKLMPAPPPLKMLDVFKRNGMKTAKSAAKSKTTQGKQGKSSSTDGFLRPIVTTSLAQNSKVPIVSNVMGNRTPIARRYPPILPKSQRSNPFAALTGDGGFLQSNSTEIKPIQNGENKEIKVYGPPSVTSAASSSKSSVSVATSLPSIQPLNQRSASKPSSSNYLNTALINSAKSKMGELQLGCRTPIYTPNSPIYSPNSPQYMPNYNIPIQPTYKYTKTQSNASNYLQSILGSNKQLSGLFPGPPMKKTESSAASNKSDSSGGIPSKRNSTSPSMGKISPEPLEKQTPVQSLLNSCNINIPSSLSITIRNEADDVDSNKSSNMKHSNPVNNYIEILKLPDAPIGTSESTKTTFTTPIDVRASSNPKSPTSMKLPGVATNPSRASPPVITAPSQLKSGNASPNSVPKSKSPSVTEHDKKISPPSMPQKSTKKTPSPEKKPSEKTTRKAEKRSLSDPIKSPKDKFDISPAALKKFRPILPRSKTPPPTGSGPVIPIASFTAKMTSKMSNSNSKPNQTKGKKSLKTANNGNNKSHAASSIKPESFVDLTASQKSTTPPTSMSATPLMPSPPTPQAGGLSAELTAFLTQQRQLLQQQQQQQQQQQNPFGALAAGNPAFLPHLAGFQAANLNMQRAYLMEQLARMQKAGADAIEKYMQMKTNTTNSVKSPSGSPGSTSAGSPPSVANNVKNSA